MTDDAQRARRRAHNAHALERCNAMGRTAGSILWQPLQTKGGKWFMPDGAELSEVPIEWRSERLDTILDEMDAIQAVAPVADPGKAYVETLDVEKWKAEADAVFGPDGAARLTLVSTSPAPFVVVDTEGAFTIGSDGAVRPMPPSTVSLEELQADVNDAVAICMDKLEKAIMTEPTTTEPVEPMLQFFSYAHLPEKLQEISKPFGEFAENLVRILPRNPERTVALRKLLEAKDCAVRARLYK